MDKEKIKIINKDKLTDKIVELLEDAFRVGYKHGKEKILKAIFDDIEKDNICLACIDRIEELKKKYGVKYYELKNRKNKSEKV